MTMNQRTIVGVFHDEGDAQRAVEDLRQMGFSAEEMGYAGHGEMPREMDGDAATGAATGGVAGMIPGGIIGGAIGAIAAGAIPGVGPVIAAGIMAATVGGAAAGAATGGVLGALAGAGVSADDASYYEGEFKSGRTLVTVRPGARYDEAFTLLRQHGAYDIDSRGQSDMRRVG